MYPSFIPVGSDTPTVVRINQYQKPMSDIEYYFAYFSLYILFPLLYNMLVSGNQSAIMTLWRFIRSGVFDSVQYIKQLANDMFYTTLRMFGQYTFSTYTVVKDGREVYTSSSLYYYYKSDVKSVYYIDRAKYNVCKWIDQQCRLYLQLHGEEPEVTEMHNDIYDFILHKVDDQPYTRIHRGDFTGRTHTLITEHYRPYRRSYQFDPRAELTVYMNSNTVEPPMGSSNHNNGADTDTDTEPCFPPVKFNINLKSPNNFFLEKNEILDTNFLKWVLYNQFGREGIAKYIRSPFYSYKLTLYYNECMKDYFKDTTKTATIDAPRIVNAEQTRFPAYTLDHTQSVVIGHTYVVKVDSLLRCPVFESNEKQVFDIDGVMSSYYDCSDSDNPREDEDDSDGVSISAEGEGANEGEDESESESDDADAATNNDTNDENSKTVANNEDGTTTDCDDPEFEVIQEPSK